MRWARWSYEIASTTTISAAVTAAATDSSAAIIDYISDHINCGSVYKVAANSAARRYTAAGNVERILTPADHRGDNAAAAAGSRPKSIRYSDGTAR